MALKELNKQNFDSEIKEGIALVDFWAGWCGPCRMIAPVVEEVAEEMPQVKVCKVNIDDEQELAVRFNVMSIPTLIVFKDGKPVANTVGVVSKQAIKDKIKAAQ